jgi:hypothetical protein
MDSPDWRLIYLILLVAGAAWLAPLHIHAQDNHYWNNQYGSRAELIGGLVVGGILDLSATYYNPGSLGFVDEPSLILTNDAWEYIGYDFEDILPQGVDLNPSRVRPAPSMFAIQIPLKETKHRLAVSALSRYSFELNADGRRYVTPEEIESDGRNPSTLEATARYRLSEGWVGVSWAHPLGSKVGIGATMYGAGRGQSARTQVIGQTVGPGSSVGSAHRINEVSYWHIRLLWKVGVSADLGPLGLGINVTTPSIGLFGDGKVIFNEGVTAADPDVGTVGEIAATDQSKLPTTYRSVAAIAGGASYRIGNTKAFVTTEYFDDAETYSVLEAEEFIGQTSGDTMSADVAYGLDAVLNWGVGVEQEFGERYHAYAAFFVDNSAFQGDALSRLAATSWDIRHITAGGAVRFNNFDVTLGMSYGFGQDSVERDVVLPGENPEAVAEYRSIKLIFGFVVAI